MSTLLEVGYDNVKSQQTGERNSQYKITLAQQWQAGDSIWSRPAIRVFATYAKWDEKWGYSKNASGDITSLAAADSSGNGLVSPPPAVATTMSGPSAHRWKSGGKALRRLSKHPPCGRRTAFSDSGGHCLAYAAA